MSNAIERIKRRTAKEYERLSIAITETDKFTKQGLLDCIKEFENTFIDIVDEELAKEPQVPQWIPCSERLPEETGYYLCSVEWYGTSTKELLISNGHEIQDRIMLLPYLESNKSFKEIENFSTYKVIAWQPLQLPQPYTENRKESQKCRKIMC